MNKEALKNFAKELVEARDKVGLSLMQISNKTRIDIKFLKSIEDADFGVMPEVYMKAFIKSYAREVGLNEEAIIKNYDNIKQGKEPEKGKSEDLEQKNEISKTKKVVEDSFSEEEAQTERKIINRKYVLGIFVSIPFLLLFLIYFLFFHKSDNEIILNNTDDEAIISNEERFIIEEQSPSPVSTEDSLTIVITAKDTVWVNVNSDDKIKNNEFTLFPNTSRTVKALEYFKINLGNAGAVSIKFGNNTYDSIGMDGEHKYIKLNRNNLEYLKLSSLSESNE